MSIFTKNFCHINLYLISMIWFLANVAIIGNASIRRQPGNNGGLALGKLSTGTEVILKANAEKNWSIEILNRGISVIRLERPVQIDLFNETGKADSYKAAYKSIRKTPSGFIGLSAVSLRQGVIFHIEDRWSLLGAVLQVDRKIQVAGNAKEGFASALMLQTEKKFSWPDVRYFVPGAMYGAPEHVQERAPGGMANYQMGAVEFREDMMAAPLFGLYFGDGTSVSMLDQHPRGDTTAADSDDAGTMQISEQFQFGGMGGHELPEGGIEFGYWFPGTQGLLAVKPSVAGARPWLRRYHPIKDGLVQRYELGIRFGQGESFHDFYKSAWRWSWKTLKPAVNYQDIAVVRRSLVDMLAAQVETHGNKTGLPNSINLAVHPYKTDRKAIMGFTGKCLEAAVFLIMEAERDHTPRGAELRRRGLSIINSFLMLKVSPPEGEGFNMDDGRVQLALPKDKAVYLRSFTDDMKILLNGYKFERARGREHPQWLKWCQEFGDWLLTQQQPSGGFPRSWVPLTGEVKVAAPQSSYNAVPLLVLLSELTGEPKYLQAGLRTAEFCWISEQTYDHFIGGTIDNPNVQDKEAATLSTEAYLALYEATRERKWLNRARAAADNAETYIYIWNVPMPEDADESRLHWKKGVPTIGLNVVSTSGPGAGDQYMSFDVDEYTKLYKYTNDRHYFDVARILLHNTKSMLAIPGRTYDLPGPGWQTEHWSLTSPRRGRGGNYLWLPWVATSHLNGILYTEVFDSALFRQLATKPLAQ